MLIVLRLISVPPNLSSWFKLAFLVPWLCGGNGAVTHPHVMAALSLDDAGYTAPTFSPDFYFTAAEIDSQGDQVDETLPSKSKVYPTLQAFTNYHLKSTYSL